MKIREPKQSKGRTVLRVKQVYQALTEGREVGLVGKVAVDDEARNGGLQRLQERHATWRTEPVLGNVERVEVVTLRQGVAKQRHFLSHVK